jgi:oligopeptide/dipeptide ABC transporter ATP-binding protein
MLRSRLGTPLLIAASASAFALLALAVLAPLAFGPAAASIRPADALQPPGATHWLGTDELGRDVFLRVLVAASLSLKISVTATLAGATLGIALGALPSVAGRLAGRLISAAIDLALAFPTLLLALFVAAIAGAGALSAFLAITLAMTPVFARLTHSLAASIARADYVAAARLLGASRVTILTRHIIPNVGGPLLVTMIVAISGALLVLSGLSFLGLGVQPPAYDWGILLNQGLNRVYVSPASSLAPAAAIVLAGIMLALVGEALALALGLRTRRAPAPAIAPQAIPEAPTQALLEVANLRIAFASLDGTPIEAVRNVSLAIAPGERVGLVGESGSGKTLTALAAAALPIDGAAITAVSRRFLGRPLDQADTPEVRHFLGRAMAFLFQDPLGSFDPVRRIGGQLAELGTEHLALTRADAQARAVDRLGRAGLDRPEDAARSYPHQLSGGMLQRAMIALGLMGEPRLLIADEPTTALDVTVQKRVLALIARTCQETGAGLLLISHDLAVVAGQCERVLVMYAGRIVEDLPAAALPYGAVHPYTRALCASVVAMDADRSRPLPTMAAGDQKAGGCAFRHRCALATNRCADSVPGLAEIASGHSIACWEAAA